MSPLGALQRSYYRSPRRRDSRIYTVDVLAHGDTARWQLLPLPSYPYGRETHISSPCPNPHPSARSIMPVSREFVFSVLNALWRFYLLYLHITRVWSRDTSARRIRGRD